MPDPIIEIGNQTDTGFTKLQFRNSAGEMKTVEIANDDKSLQINDKPIYTQGVNQQRGTANFIEQDEITIVFDNAFKTPPKITLQKDESISETMTFSKSKTQLIITFSAAVSTSVDWLAVE